MARKRFLDTGIWANDEYFKALNCQEKLLWIYLRTNSDVEYFGVMNYFPPKITEETGLKLTKVKQIIQKFERDNIIIVEQFKLFLHNFIKAQGPVNSCTLSSFNAKKHNLPQKIRQATEIDLNTMEGGSAGDSEGGSERGLERDSEPSTEPINNNKKEVIKEKREDIKNNKNLSVIAGSKFSDSEKAGNNTSILPQLNEIMLSDDESFLIERIASGFKETFGWSGNCFEEKYLQHFIETARRITAETEDLHKQSVLIEYLLKSLHEWSEKGDPIHPKIIAPGHLSSDFIWTTVLPQYLSSMGLSMKELE